MNWHERNKTGFTIEIFKRINQCKQCTPRSGGLYSITFIMSIPEADVMTKKMISRIRLNKKCIFIELYLIQFSFVLNKQPTDGEKKNVHEEYRF